MYKIEKDNDYILITEFNSVRDFLLKKYNIDILFKKYYSMIVRDSLLFSLSMKIWKEKFEKDDKISEYFQECSANIFNIMILSILNMKIPALTMIRRTQELVLKSIYYIEHPVECYKKENNDEFRLFKKDDELKEYLKTYPFSSKYNIDDSKLQKFLSDIMKDWDKQYSELSKFVHATNSKYFQNIEYLEDFIFNDDDTYFLGEQIIKLSSMVNTLLIIFFFKEYLDFKEVSEKSIIRKSIYNQFRYKENIVKLFKEI